MSGYIKANLKPDRYLICMVTCGNGYGRVDDTAGNLTTKRRSIILGGKFVCKLRDIPRLYMTVIEEIIDCPRFEMADLRNLSCRQSLGLQGTNEVAVFFQRLLYALYVFLLYNLFGAHDGNRTHEPSVEDWYVTATSHVQIVSNDGRPCVHVDILLA